MDDDEVDVKKADAGSKWHRRKEKNVVDKIW